jgi:hypothetical protein
VLAGFPNRVRTDRSNPYTAPQGYLRLAKAGLESFETRQCSSGINTSINPTTASDPNFQARSPGGDAAGAATFLANIERFVFTNKPTTNALPHPSCTQQAKFQSIGVSPELTRYLQVRKEK